MGVYILLHSEEWGELIADDLRTGVAVRIPELAVMPEQDEEDTEEWNPSPAAVASVAAETHWSWVDRVLSCRDEYH